ADQGVHDREVPGEFGAVETERGGLAPRRAGPVQEGYVLLLQRGERLFGILGESLGNSRRAELEGPQAVVAGPEVHALRTFLDSDVARVVLQPHNLGVAVDESICVLRETRTRG